MKLSICMIVKDEEINLERCLKSLQSLLNDIEGEIIIVDTGSSDRTVEIAKRYTDKVYYRQWNNNFSEMRNYSISLAKGEWIFVVDADEEFVDEKSLLVKFLRKEEQSKFNTITIKVDNIVSMDDRRKDVLTYSSRLFRNESRDIYKGVIHNEPECNAPVAQVDAILVHYGYISSDNDLMERKFSRTSNLLKQELERNPDNIYYRFQLSVSYAMHKDSTEALHEIEKAYELLKSKQLNPKTTFYIYPQLIKCYIVLQKFDKAEMICKEAIALYEDYFDLYYYLGKSCAMQNKNDEAIDSYLKFIKLKDKKDIPIIESGLVNVDTLGFLDEIYCDLLKLYFVKKDFQKSIKFALNIEKPIEAEKAYRHIVASYVWLEDLEGLHNYYKTRVLPSREKNIINSFIYALEEKSVRLTSEKLGELHELFMEEENDYGEFNKLRVMHLKQIADLESRLNDFVNNVDFREIPSYCGEIIFLYIISFIKIEEKIINLDDKLMNQIFESLGSKYKELPQHIMLYIDKVSFSKSLKEIRILIILCKYALIFAETYSDEEYINVFKQYIKFGDEYIKRVFSEEYLREETLYSNETTPENIFFIYMKCAEENKYINDLEYIKYLKKALGVFPYMSKGIGIILRDLGLNHDKNLNTQEKSEINVSKQKFKKNVEMLINDGYLAEAKKLLDEYENTFKNDFDIYDIKAVIAIMEERYSDAEKLLKQCLDVDLMNTDALYNLVHLYNKENLSKAVEVYTEYKLKSSKMNISWQEFDIGSQKVDENNLRVLQGTMEIANQMYTISKGLELNEIYSKTLSYYPSYLKYKSDYSIDIPSLKDMETIRNKTIPLAAKLIAEHDVFHFHFGTSLTLDNSDLPLLNELDKKILMHHWGSDVRMLSKALEFNPFAVVKDTDENRIKKRLELLSKYIPNCIVADYELYEYVKDYYQNVFIVPQAIDLESYNNTGETTKNSKFLVVHAPTSPEVKGTKYIIEAVDELKSQYNFEFILIQGMSHEEAKKIYAKADLIIDQVLLGTYGLFAVECMAMGKPVISWISDYAKSKYPDSLPIISSNPQNLKEKIEFILKNRDLCCDLGTKGRQYVMKHHDMMKVSRELIEIYKKI